MTMKSMHTTALLYGLAAFTAGAYAVPAQSPGVTRPEFHECQIGAEDSAERQQALCTTFMVPEDRQHPEGRKIGLHVAWLRARASNPKPDALFFIAGGPGQASTEAFLEEAPAFDRIRSEHDVLLVDQRGTGSSNRLDCPPPPADMQPTDAEIAAAAQACLKQLPGDPRFYTTQVALQYLRAYPDSVRAVVLDGVVPADLALGPGVSLDAQRALGLIFTRCEKDPGCRQAFPDLATDFSALQKDLNSHAVSVSLRDPLTGAPRTEQLTWEKVATAVRLMSYQSETAALLPLLIHQAAVQHDYLPLMSTALLFSDQLQESFAQGMGASVLCTE